ncbi:uncharacterized protein LOC143291242 [Babylonia areolata]|uniref:uncharacterized protein LOC143291242 n=1 Tax=Babylonia areolata TaxID=304850 RepID=UPI003FD2253C
MMMVKLNWVVGFVLAGVWVCGNHFAQAQIESGSLTQDMVPRESKTCKEIRYNLEMMLFTLYKATVPRHALKQVLPGLAEPLLPVQCLRGEGQGKWLLHPQPLGTDPQPPRVRRQIGQFFLSAPLTSVKDPDDLPHAGMLLRDPSKDPGDHPFSSPWAPHPSLPPFDPLIKPFRGGFYGDQLPRGRRRRRSVDDAEEEEEVGKEADVAHVRRKRANGEEEKKGPSWDTFGFPGFLFSDVPDHRAPAPVPVVFPFSETSLFLSGLRQLFSPPRHSHRRRRPGRSNNNNNNNNPLLRQSGTSSVALQDPYGARPNVIYGDSPPYRQTVTSRQAPVVPAPPAPVGPWSPQGQPSAPPPAAAAPSPVVISPANQASAAQANVVQPSGARSLARQPLGNQPLWGQPLGNQPLGGQPLGTQPLGGQPLGNQPLGGQPLGDQLLGGQPLRNQPLGGQPLRNQPLGGQPLGTQPLGGHPLGNQPVWINVSVSSTHDVPSALCAGPGLHPFAAPGVGNRGNNLRRHPSRLQRHQHGGRQQQQQESEEGVRQQLSFRHGHFRRLFHSRRHLNQAAQPAGKPFRRHRSPRRCLPFPRSASTSAFPQVQQRPSSDGVQ